MLFARFAGCLLSCLALLVLFSGPARAVTTIRLGIVTTPGTAQHVTAARFKELLEERTRGEAQVRILHSGSLGSETEILQQIQLGAVELGIITLGPFDVFVPEVKVVNFPFLFRGYEQADKVLDGPIGRDILAALERAGFKGLAFSENGFRNLTNDTRPVHRVEDVQGLKIRVMESELHKELWRALGANPTPMAWPIYAELEQGAIDGQENPLSVLWTYKLYEVQKYLTLTGHVYSAHIDVAGLAWFDSLSPDLRALIQECMREAAVHQRAWNRRNVADFLVRLRAAGMQVDEHPDLDSFKARAARLKNLPVYSSPPVQALLERILAATR